MSITRKNGPLYLQIKKIIKDRILHGIYPLGIHIPAEPQLEQEFQVSKMTVRNAIRELAEEGYVEKKSGVGTIVLRNTSLSRLSKGKRFTELLVESGHRMEKRLIASGPASLQSGTELRELFGSSCHRIERLYLLNDQPYIHFIHYITPVIGFHNERAASEQLFSSLYDWLEEKKIALENFRDRFLVETAAPDTAQLLGIEEGAAVLKRLRYSYDGEGNVIECSIGYYNTALHPYLVDYDA
ncbi:GntR family transcriptional regulator [Paenibacillus mendelii]|uniref:GntR family transcriptional regulator n=1 Tax=Paenibacillus mendelii TaxID=206163 RepID=A0ABV6J5T4_9BACL|nr:GntR family transcriptional regulator [Paenibacillus mendelii]MCQ6559283.1 GntR family transcriptional regulator [Paenibacillus mendelii]